MFGSFNWLCCVWFVGFLFYGILVFNDYCCLLAVCWFCVVFLLRCFFEFWIMLVAAVSTFWFGLLYAGFGLLIWFPVDFACGGWLGWILAIV